VSVLSISLKKNGLWMRWLIWILIVLNIAFLFQSYPKYWIVSIFWTSFDIKQYASLFITILWIITAISREKKRF
jgi:hypothetical protein